jgi:hypothetical protein
MLGGEDDRLGDDLGVVDRRRRRDLRAELAPGLFEQRGVDGRRRDVGDVEVAVLLPQLQAQALGDPLDRVLGGAVDRLDREGADAGYRAEVNDGAPALPAHVG